MKNFAVLAIAAVAQAHIQFTEETDLDALFGEQLGGVIKCQACGEVVRKLSQKLNEPNIQKKITELAVDLCLSPFIPAPDKETVCPTMVPLMAPTFLDLIANDLMTELRLCNEVLGFCERPKVSDLEVSDYKARVLADKPDNTKENDFVNKMYEQIYADTKERETLTFLHISDIHIDLDYKVGTNAVCGSYLCCREENGIPTDQSKAARQWGEYTCDLPLETFQDMLKHIQENVKGIDAVFWTGDNSPHNTWDNSNEEVTHYTKVLTAEIKDSFKGTNIPIYPSTGNHDTWPVNVQNWNEPYSNYPINNFYADWADWLGEEALEEFKKYGYCSIPFKLTDGTELKGSKVIVLQTQAANDENWYMPGFQNDPAGHIAWLEETLAQIERDGGIAYLIGHIMPSSFTYQFGARYQILMERYQHIIRFSMYGHTHDQYYWVSSTFDDASKHIGVGQIGPSVTTLTDENPGFALIDVDKETLLPINWRIFAMDLEEANNEGKPVWRQMIDYSKDYDLGGVSPNSLYGLAERLQTDADLYWQFRWDKSRQKGDIHIGSETEHKAASHGDYCNYTSTSGWGDSQCNGSTKQSNMDRLIGKWKTTSRSDAIVEGFLN